VEDFLFQAALWVVPMVLAITLHEIAHGYAALALGDDTAKREGRLSLNPLRHVDRFGTIILPGFLIITQLLTVGRVLFAFGWAKPVPVDPYNFQRNGRFINPRRGMMLVAMAGPAMNFFLAWLSALALHPLGDANEWVAVFGEYLLLRFIIFNLVLGLFNLLPIPPLDGGRIMVGLLPYNLAVRWARLERSGILIVLLVVFLLPHLAREFGIRFDPVGDALNQLVPWAIRVIFELAGHGEETDGGFNL
jgi:Zn-dependent protease